MSAPRPQETDPFHPLNSINTWQQLLYIQQHSSYFLHVVRSSVSYGGAHLKIAHAFWHKNSNLWFRVVINLVIFHMVRAGAYWHKINDLHACAFAAHTKQFVISFGFLFWRLVQHYILKWQTSQETNKVQEAKFMDCHWCILIHFASVYFDDQ